MENTNKETIPLTEIEQHRMFLQHEYWKLERIYEGLCEKEIRLDQLSYSLNRKKAKLDEQLKKTSSTKEA